MRFLYTKTFLAFALSLFAVFLFLFLQFIGWLRPIEAILVNAPRPIEKGVSAAVSPVKTFFTTLFSMKSIVRENSALNDKLKQLTQSQVDLDALKQENELLKRELNFKNKSGLALEPCTILSVDPQNLSDSIILNCGSDNGIKEGHGVISDGFLIAKIVYAASGTSTAQLISNPQSTVDAKISNNNTEGVVKGSFGSGIVFDLVSQNAQINEGDIVVTAGLSDKIPKNILIGSVGQKLSGDNDLFKKLSLVTPIKFKSVDYVFVVK